MFARGSSATVALSLAICAGCALPAADETTTGSVASFIAGGEPAPDAYGVVGLLTGHGSCSGTLIAPNLVLTAHHCVADSPPGSVTCGEANFGPLYTNPLSITTRETVFAAWRQRVKSVFVPPDASDVCGGDVAVMILEENVEPSEAWPIPPRVDEEPEPDELYTAVGFGATADDGSESGLRRQRSDLHVKCLGGSCSDYFQVQDSEWLGEAGICPGDSGGPAIDEQGRVIGVTSRGGVNCSTPIYSGVAAWSAWLREMGAKAASEGGYDPWPWVTGGSSLPLEPPEPEPEAGPEAEPSPAATSSQSGGGCSIVAPHGRWAWAAGWSSAGAALLLAIAVRARRRRV